MMNFSTRSISQSCRFTAAGTHRAHSVAGGAGIVKMSAGSVNMARIGVPAFGGGLAVQDASAFGNNGKETMNNLNDRLAIYLERVHSLEQANRDLEAKIHEFYEKKASISAFDPSGFYKTISHLRSQIKEATTDNTRLVLQIDNAKLAADDFKTKFESELAIRLGVDGDINGLRRALDELTMQKSELEMELESMKEELIHLKINHEEELALHQRDVGGNVHVELDSAPLVDLTKALAEVREQYEDMMDKNHQEAEALYRTQNEGFSKEITVNQQSFQTSRTEITDLKRTAQSLELELQSLMNMKHALEGALAETEGQYGAKLGDMQNFISQTENDLQQVRTASEQHSLEYRVLLDAKTKLEIEIATYRRLLDGEDRSLSTHSQMETQKNVKIVSKEETSSSTVTIQKVKTIVEEVVDGKVVTSSVQEVIQTSKTTE
ncbi:keratin, type I cytoskeletal 47 kDa-like [Pseudophryne corroboree]|uniref:keratin, type I cytoskeletal 47 kDa-like n=1 Tax=Pseudophryne corroboree TaxID=495146 RepID=UPI0030819419